jgi:hypothetical protein
MAPRWKPIGTRPTYKVQGRSSTQMAITSRATITCPKSKEEDFSDGKTHSIRENSRKTSWRDMPASDSQKQSTTKAASRTANEMEKGCIDTPTATNSVETGRTMKK